MTITAILIVCAMAHLFLAGIVAYQGFRRTAYRLFVGICICFAVWALSIAGYLATTDANTAIMLAKTYYVVAALFPSLFLTFALTFPKDDHRVSRLTIWLVLLLGAVVALTVFFLPNYMVQGIVMTTHPYVVLNHPAYLLYSIYFVIFFVAALLVALRKFLHYKGDLRMQAGLYALGILGNSIPGFITNLILPYFHIYEYIWVGPVVSFTFLGLTTYAIIRHGLFDIRLVAVRSVAYFFTLLSLAIVYSLIIDIVSRILLAMNTGYRGTDPLNVIIALALAFLFQPIKHVFDRATNAIFYRDTYDFDEFFAHLTKKLSASTEIHTLLSVASADIAKTLKASFASFFVYRDDKPALSVSTDHHRHGLPVDDTRTLEIYAHQHRGRVIARSQLTADDDDTRGLRRLLVSHQAELILPIFQENAVLGYLMLGAQLSSQYTIRDIRLLATIAPELTIAIENALSVQEVRDLNDTLQQRINSATSELRHSNSQLQQLDAAKDEFISMASHQLRTPLTTIKGYISMVIEGDAGKITPEQKRLLEEAFTSSERMVRLIGDFLNVSRLQTGKFVIERQPTNLAKVVAEELESLGPNAAARGIRFIYKEPKDFPILYLDETKIRQVIMNFSDNALYYSGKGKTVDISLKLEKGEVMFTVKDHGIGVPKEQQAHLFQKFFRATNARSERPDGTGVGLFLAKRVIDDHHGGLIFESTEGKGSTFGFRLPLAEVKIPDNQKPLA